MQATDETLLAVHAGSRPDCSLDRDAQRLYARRVTPGDRGLFPERPPRVHRLSDLTYFRRQRSPGPIYPACQRRRPGTAMPHNGKSLVPNDTALRAAVIHLLATGIP